MTKKRSNPPPETPAGDAELAALVQGATPSVDADASLASLVSPKAEAVADPTETAAQTVAAVPVVPLAAAVADDTPAGRPRRRRSLTVRFGAAFVVGFLLAVGVGAGVLFAWDQQYDGRVLPGVRVGETALGGLTREQAETALANDYGWLSDGQITLTGPDGEVTTLSYADVDRGPDTKALLDAALSAGRQGEPLANLIGQPQIAINGLALDSAVAYDRAKVAAAVDTLARAIDQTPTDASVAAGAGAVFDVTPAKDGRAVDRTALLAALDQQLAALDAPATIALDVPMVTLPPAVTTATAEEARSAAYRMTADVVVARGDDTWTVDSAQLAPLVSFMGAEDGSITPVLYEAGLDPVVQSLAKQVNQKVRDAGLKRVKQSIVVTHGSREGRAIIADGMKAALVTEITARQAGAAATPVEAVVKAVDPKLTTADAKAFAPDMRPISKFSVFYWVIVNNYWGGNIEAPATKIDGTVVPPGGKFDFWKVVGDLRDLPGTGPGNAIVDGKITVTGAFGGGICTTSTTLFNAAFRAGMVPLARKNHNEFIDRYPAGLDATVWIVGKAKQTMSFKNDTKYPILIQRVITQEGNKRWLTFKIWSVPNGRKATVTNTVIKPGPFAKDTVAYDASKPVGYTYRNNAPADGAKVWTTVSIYERGKLHWSKRYYSNYPAVDGVLIKGTKGS